MKTVPRHPKLRGEWAEVRFLARAYELGLRVSKPYGDCLPYDFIVEHRGRMFRVQVKSTSYHNPNCGGYKCLVRPPRGSRYPIGTLDFLAAYVIPEDVWYIIPYKQLTAKNSISLDPRSQRNTHRQYREAWDLLLTEPLADLRRRTKKDERLLASRKGRKASRPLSCPAGAGRVGRPPGSSRYGTPAAAGG
jgi:hypothetical protein